MYDIAPMLTTELTDTRGDRFPAKRCCPDTFRKGRFDVETFLPVNTRRLGDQHRSVCTSQCRDPG